MRGTCNAGTLKLRLPKDDPGIRIVPEVAPLSHEMVLYKISGSAFNSTPLNVVLQNMGRKLLLLRRTGDERMRGVNSTRCEDFGYNLIVAERRVCRIFR